MQGRWSARLSREARAECAASPTARNDCLLSLTTSSAVLSLLRPLDVCTPGKSDSVVMRVFVQQWPARQSNRRVNPLARGSDNGNGGTSNVAMVLLGPGPAVLSFNTCGCQICQGNVELEGAIAALRMESAFIRMRRGASGGSESGSARSLAVRAQVGVICCRTGLRGVGVCWFCVCGTGDSEDRQN